LKKAPDASRRRFVIAGVCVAAATTAGVGARLAVAPAARDAIGPETPARIMLRSPALGEELDLEYRVGDVLVPPAIARIGALLRDPVTGEQGPVDTRLIDFLGAIATALGVPAEFDVLAGFESPRPGGRARWPAAAASAGLHGQGRALDVRLRGVASADFAARAVRFSRGGIGYYAAVRCVHVDTGPARHWRG
jgi:uncharacterized protein YcbK (DUF882 family)